jgi:ubiquinol-cytochrome c reductase cytochrome c1 subunit
MMKNRIASLLLTGLVALPGVALAAGGAGKVEDVDFSFEGPFGTYDTFQLQRGFQVFHEVCAGCHGIQYVAFRDLGDPNGPALPEEQIRAIAEQYEVFDKGPEAAPGDMRTALPSDKFPANKALGAPDLSLMAKARAGFHGPMGTGINQLFKGIGGPEYIYSLLNGYTGEEVEQAGALLYENTVMAGGLIQMAPPLYGDDVEYTVHGDANGYVPPEATVSQQSKDVAAFLMWAAEPKLVERKEAGFRNLIWLIVLSVLLYFTNKRIWAPVKGDH